MDLKDLPSIDSLASTMTSDFDRIPRPVVVSVCRTALDRARSEARAGGEPDPVSVAAARLADIDAARPQAVINATGVLLHTNLGRASMAVSAAARLAGLATMPGNVEVDIRTGRRAKRNDYLGALLPAASGAEAGFAVNNNAGALLLALASVAGRGGKVAVSRGELIEIGGSFRLPELMRASGAVLVEVGTTNRTRLSDFSAVAGSVDAILKVHPSNYRIEGFKEEASHHDLSALAREHGVRVILNPAPARELSDEILGNVSILTPNESEAELLTGIRVEDDAGAEQAARALVARGVDTVILTLGSRGAFVFEAGSGELVPSFKVQAVDTTAAGDVFNGSLAVSLAEGMPLTRAVRFANAAAALSVTRLGAQPSAPTRSEIEAFLSGS